MKKNQSPVINRFSIFSLIWILVSCAPPQEATFPGKNWDHVQDVAEYDYSREKLDRARAYADSINTAAVMIVVDGKILEEWGEVEKKYNTHSVRKSFLSALYGNYVHDGTIDLDITMEDLGIGDIPPLTEEERQATVRDVLKSRTGVYHPALYESQGMKDLKPERFTQRAGTHWYYNNWDFNVAGTIFTELTGKGVYEAIFTEIAQPVGMEQFTIEDGNYVTGEESIHQAYPFRINARDLARFGLLMLRKGKWNGKQLIPEDWVDESTSYHSDATLYSSDGYGYMWWVARDHNKYPHLQGVSLKEGSYSARGAGGHYVLIIPDYDMVLVHRVDTDIRGNRVSSAEFGRLVNLILASKNQDE